MTTLITGGMGFIGLHTARAFLDAGEDVVITYFQLTFRTLFWNSEAILPEPPAESRGRAIHG